VTAVALGKSPLPPTEFLPLLSCAIVAWVPDGGSVLLSARFFLSAAVPRPPPLRPTALCIMSWQPYIDDQLLAKGFMHAAIVSHAGSLWAASEDFFIHPSEVSVLVAALVPPSDDAAMKHLATRGFTLNETGRYALTRADVSDEELVPMLIGRCKTVGEPSTGVVVCATHSALVVGIYDGAYSEGASFGGVRCWRCV